jgi:hypothetical protein
MIPRQLDHHWGPLAAAHHRQEQNFDPKAAPYTAEQIRNERERDPSSVDMR